LRDGRLELFRGLFAEIPRSAERADQGARTQPWLEATVRERDEEMRRSPQAEACKQTMKMP
jgi:hypothetical protein